MRLPLILTALSFLLLVSCGTGRRAKAEPTRNHHYKPKPYQEIVDYARKYIGTPYKYAGKDPRGFDCSGFTSYVFKAFHKQLAATAEGQSRQIKEISRDNVQAGDLVFFKRPGSRKVFHVSLVVSNGREGIVVIHSTTSRGVIVENISQSSYWKPFLYKTGRFLD